MSDTEFNDQKAISAMQAIYDRIRPEVAARYRAEFDRWLTGHDREVAAKALRHVQALRGGDIEQEYIDAALSPYRGTPEQEGEGDVD